MNESAGEYLDRLEDEYDNSKARIQELEEEVGGLKEQYRLGNSDDLLEITKLRKALEEMFQSWAKDGEDYYLTIGLTQEQFERIEALGGEKKEKNNPQK